MRERFQHWPPKLNKWWVMGAIATPVLLGTVGGLWLRPKLQLPSHGGRSSHHESAALVHPHRESSIRGVGAITAVAGSVLVILKFCNTHSSAKTTKLSGMDLRCADLSGVDLSEANLSGLDCKCINFCDANLSGADLSGTDLNEANLSGANLSGANLSGANLISANLSGANLNGAELRYANLSGADLRYTNLSGANLRSANLSGADLNCALISDANFSDANLSNALLFFVNSREVQNLEPLQLKAQPSPFLCNVALPAYSQQPRVNPDRDCHRIPQLLSARYHISLEEAQGIVDEARQHRWA